jgi:hypothetical protein
MRINENPDSFTRFDMYANPVVNQLKYSNELEG